MSKTARRLSASVIAVVVRVPYEASDSSDVGHVLATAIRAALSTPEGRSTEPDEDEAQRLDVLAIGPHQINRLDGADVVTVTYPVGTTTVLSIQPDGTVETRPAGSQGPYECALLKPDRLIFAPLGPTGQGVSRPLRGRVAERVVFMTLKEFRDSTRAVSDGCHACLR